MTLATPLQHGAQQRGTYVLVHGIGEHPWLATHHIELSWDGLLLDDILWGIATADGKHVHKNVTIRIEHPALQRWTCACGASGRWHPITSGAGTPYGVSPEAVDGARRHVDRARSRGAHAFAVRLENEEASRVGIGGTQ